MISPKGHKNDGNDGGGMGLRIRLEWYDKESELGVGEEMSKDFGQDRIVLDALGIPIENNINNGGFNVLESWVAHLQPHFQHAIDLSAYDYQVAFDYRDVW